LFGIYTYIVPGTREKGIEEIRREEIRNREHTERDRPGTGNKRNCNNPEQERYGQGKIRNIFDFSFYFAEIFVILNGRVII
jgi:hypothetical protein